MKKWLVLLLGTVCVCNALAQLPISYVSTVTGKSVVVRAGKRYELNRSFLVYVTDSIIIQKGSKITFVDYGKNYLVASTPGKFAYVDLQKKSPHKETGLSAKFFEFIYEDLFKPSGEQLHLSARNIGGAFGGASRGNCEILLKPENNFILYGDTIFFNWHTLPGVTAYCLTLQDAQQKELVNIIIADTAIALLKRNWLKDSEAAITWQVHTSNAGNNACTSTFTIITEEEHQSRLSALLQSVPKEEDEAIYFLKAAELLGKAGLYADAYAYFIKAKDIVNPNP